MTEETNIPRMTPGDWYVGRNPAPGYPPFLVENYQGEPDDDALTIADVELEGDACAIAAVPDLVEACEEMADALFLAYEQLPPLLALRASMAQKQGLAALAKARGEQHG